MYDHLQFNWNGNLQKETVLESKSTKPFFYYGYYVVRGLLSFSFYQKMVFLVGLYKIIELTVHILSDSIVFRQIPIYWLPIFYIKE